MLENEAREEDMKNLKWCTETNEAGRQRMKDDAEKRMH